MRPEIQSRIVRPYVAAAAAAIVALGVVTAPPSIAVPRSEVHAVALASVDVVDASAFATTPAPTPRPASSSQTANDSAAPPDFLAFAASILEYLNSLGLGPGPGLAAIGLSGVVVAFAATAYAWNGFANLVNPVLRVFHVPRVPKFPVCFAGQSCSGSASAQARLKPAGRVEAPTRATGSTGRSTASSGRTASGAAKVRGAKKPTASAAAGPGKGGSKRGGRSS
ncbi:hypothetical protein [Mycolicibacterium aichiense]|uniref:Transmembrane protein n=1 Tax=Mycolicibacterium aichiense TaxID=1799 RepID=A0AAD1HPB4_9MYCO|nr:hypothetical protein [Mycolicibacterium aichiense]BBX08845.1 hypothetical protein MAIC_36480 [Mycolicibacterium aichiense]STZ82640.1 Uncharacterised protein [Mycolicibacterium aichiense]